ncbi:MAG: hypothetical protein KC619_23095 [Myxococcales bacterium]|nr:hypothetical protein [Myxococcales bacterium]
MARETGRPDTRSVYLRSAIMAPDAVTLADVRDLYEPADASGRTAILFAATRDGTRESVEGLVELLETYPGEQFLDAESLVALRQHADLYLARLVALPDESSGHALGIETAQLLCGRRAPHSLFTPLQNALLFEWAAARGGLGQSDPAGYGEESRRAEAAIRALGCVDTAAVGPVIEEASRLADPHVAVAAVEGMLGRGDRIDPATIHRLAEAPESRWRIFRALEGTSSLRLVPRALRTSRALADGFVAQWGGPWTHVGVERRRFAGVEMDVHVYESGDMRIAAGPFADDAADDVVEVSAEEENVWSPSDLADALHASWAEGIAE